MEKQSKTQKRNAQFIWRRFCRKAVLKMLNTRKSQLHSFKIKLHYAHGYTSTASSFIGNQSLHVCTQTITTYPSSRATWSLHVADNKTYHRSLPQKSTTKVNRMAVTNTVYQVWRAARTLTAVTHMFMTARNCFLLKNENEVSEKLEFLSGNCLLLRQSKGGYTYGTCRRTWIHKLKCYTVNTNAFHKAKRMYGIKKLHNAKISSSNETALEKLELLFSLLWVDDLFATLVEEPKKIQTKYHTAETESTNQQNKTPDLCIHMKSTLTALR